MQDSDPTCNSSELSCDDNDDDATRKEESPSSPLPISKDRLEAFLDITASCPRRGRRFETKSRRDPRRSTLDSITCDPEAGEPRVEDTESEEEEGSDDEDEVEECDDDEDDDDDDDLGDEAVEVFDVDSEMDDETGAEYAAAECISADDSVASESSSASTSLSQPRSLSFEPGSLLHHRPRASDGSKAEAAEEAFQTIVPRASAEYEEEPDGLGLGSTGASKITMGDGRLWAGSTSASGARIRPPDLSHFRSVTGNGGQKRTEDEEAVAASQEESANGTCGEEQEEVDAEERAVEEDENGEGDQRPSHRSTAGSEREDNAQSFPSPSSDRSARTPSSSARSSSPAYSVHSTPSVYSIHSTPSVKSAQSAQSDRPDYSVHPAHSISSRRPAETHRSARSAKSPQSPTSTSTTTSPSSSLSDFIVHDSDSDDGAADYVLSESNSESESAADSEDESSCTRDLVYSEAEEEWDQDEADDEGEGGQIADNGEEGSEDEESEREERSHRAVEGQSRDCDEVLRPCASISAANSPAAEARRRHPPRQTRLLRVVSPASPTIEPAESDRGAASRSSTSSPFRTIVPTPLRDSLHSELLECEATDLDDRSHTRVPSGDGSANVDSRSAEIPVESHVTALVASASDTRVPMSVPQYASPTPASPSPPALPPTPKGAAYRTPLGSTFQFPQATPPLLPTTRLSPAVGSGAFIARKTVVVSRGTEPAILSLLFHRISS
ncbi:hypothetical protein BDK51DRAFT_30075 [Blyttiomyces helicus]|uniref:Uncharacterized protein n=1 Tax=Blyttiomyces helicus TaxID=388810 RepID=A0A4P9WE49_9FUNG|nr:hypothetical protein BDK51DRAFT_30075 [Blyttiomyces helicus]|eukprot:RKO90035.1 hypothetical protein BDK51DRAFT_30075 [Blyttiomyces helicus]